MPKPTCVTIDCSTPAAGRGKYCAPHSPRRARSLSLEQRIHERLAPAGPEQCWLWTGYVSSDGAATLRYKSTNVAAHRFLFEAEHGPIPEAMVVIRSCPTSACVNPAHHRLARPEPGTGGGPAPIPVAERFWAKVQKGAGCWKWQGYLNNAGYGKLYVNAGRRHCFAHRFAYELLVGPIPEGAEIDHICHTPSCVNPEHLRLATHALNSQNRSGPPIHNKSGYLGVYFETRSQRWIAQVKLDGQTFSQRFHNKEDAADAVVTARNRLFVYNTLDRV